MFPTPTAIGTTCKPRPNVPSQWSEKNMGKEPSGIVVWACLIQSPYCMPPPYAGALVRFLARGSQCRSAGWCRRAASNQPHIGSMNVKCTCVVPLGKLNWETSITELCRTSFQNFGIQSRLLNITRLFFGNCFSIPPGKKDSFRTPARAVSITTLEKGCNFKKYFQKSPEYLCLHCDNISSHLSWMATKFLFPLGSERWSSADSMQ